MLLPDPNDPNNQLPKAESSENEKSPTEGSKSKDSLEPDGIENSQLPTVEPSSSAQICLDDLALVSCGGTIRPASIETLDVPLKKLSITERMAFMYAVIENLEALQGVLPEVVLSARLYEALEWRRHIGWNVAEKAEHGAVITGDLLKLYTSGLEQLLDARVRTEGLSTGSAAFPSCSSYIDATIEGIRLTLHNLHEFGYLSVDEPQKEFQDALIEIATRRRDLGPIVSDLLSEAGRDRIHQAFGEWYRITTRRILEAMTPEDHARFNRTFFPQKEDATADISLESTLAKCVSSPLWEDPLSELLERVIQHNQIIWRQVRSPGLNPELDSQLLQSLPKLGQRGFKEWCFAAEPFDLHSIVALLRDECRVPVSNDSLQQSLTEYITGSNLPSLASYLQLPRELPQQVMGWLQFWDEIVQWARECGATVKLVSGSIPVEPAEGQKTVLIKSFSSVSEASFSSTARQLAISVFPAQDQKTSFVTADLPSFGFLTGYHVANLKNKQGGWSTPAAGMQVDQLTKFLDLYNESLPRETRAEIKADISKHCLAPKDLVIFVRTDRGKDGDDGQDSAVPNSPAGKRLVRA